METGLNDEPRGLDTLVDLSAHLNHEDNEPTHLPDRDTAPSSSGMVNPVLSGGSEPRARTRSRSGSTALRSSLNSFSAGSAPRQHVGPFAAFAPLTRSNDVRTSVQSTAASNALSPGDRRHSPEQSNQSGSISFGESGASPTPAVRGEPRRAHSMVARAAEDAASRGREAGREGAVRASSSRRLKPGELPRVALLGQHKAEEKVRAREEERARSAPRSPGMSMAASRASASTAAPRTPSTPPSARRAPAPAPPRHAHSPARQDRPPTAPPRHAHSPARPSQPPAHAPRPAWIPGRRMEDLRGAWAPARGRGGDSVPRGAVAGRGGREGRAARSVGPPVLSTELRARNPSFVRRKLNASTEAGLLPPQRSEYECMSALSRRKAEDKYRIDMAEVQARAGPLPRGASRIEVLAAMGTDTLRRKEDAAQRIEEIRYLELVEKDPLVRDKVGVSANSRRILQGKMQDRRVAPEDYYAQQRAWLENIREKAQRAQKDTETERERQAMAECTFRPRINPPGVTERILRSTRASSAPRQRQGGYRSPTASSRARSVERPRDGASLSSQPMSARGASPPAHSTPPARAGGAGRGGEREGQRPWGLGEAGRGGGGGGQVSAATEQLFDLSGLEARLGDVMSRTPVIDATALSMRTLSSDGEESDGGQPGADLSKFFKPLSLEALVQGSKRQPHAFHIEDGGESMATTPPPESRRRGAEDESDGEGIGVGLLSPSRRALMQTAESMADGGELEPEVQLVMRHANSNQRHVERLRQARDLQAQKEAKLRKFDGSTWQPGSTVGAAPKISVPQERKARKAMAKELRALKAPVSAHTPFAKSIRASQSLDHVAL